jgi:hypothetical protein
MARKMRRKGGGPAAGRRRIEAWKAGNELGQGGPVTTRRADGSTEVQPPYSSREVRRIQRSARSR